MLIWTLLLACSSTPIEHPPPPDPDATPTVVGAVDGTAGEPQPQPLVILVSFDGFRADYIDRYETPALDRLSGSGVRAAALVPVFPSKTFPNHYTQVTGLYPHNHGIVGNSFFDPQTNSVFSMSSTESHWWGGEPIWVTAEKQGELAATCFWVGSEAEIQGTRPTWWLPYDGRMSDRARIEQVMAWIDLPQRPSLITTYFSQVDSTGHSYGPATGPVEDAVTEVDDALGWLLDGLEERGLTDVADVIVVSDHGMAQLSPERLVFLDDYIDTDDPDTYILSWGAIATVDVPAGEVKSVLAALKGAANLTCAARAETPAHWHHSDSDRIAAVVCAADDGWSVTSRGWFEDNPNSYDGGTHGYDPTNSSMHGIFVASGPHFAQQASVPAFEAVEIYNMLAVALGIEAADNDGDLSRVPGVLAE